MFLKIANKAKTGVNRLRCAVQFPYHKVISGERNIILMYHGVCKSPNPFNRRHCYLTDFERQIKYLSKCANIISVEDFFEEKFDPKLSNVAITFDDGYLNNLEIALPILEKYGVKASIYITGLARSDEKIIWADFLQIICNFRKDNFSLCGENYVIEKNQALRETDGKTLLEIIKHEKPDYSFKKELYRVLSNDFSLISEKTAEHWRLMSDDCIIKLSKSPCITIGSHGWQHNNLGKIEKTYASWELSQSKQYLENLIQKPVCEIAFPDGSYSLSTLNQCSDIGFRYMLAADYFLDPDDCNHPNLRKRFGIYQIGSWSDQIVFKSH